MKKSDLLFWCILTLFAAVFMNMQGKSAKFNGSASRYGIINAGADHDPPDNTGQSKAKTTKLTYSWKEVQPAGDGDFGWECSAMSADGSVIIAAQYWGGLYLSTDKGENWTEVQPEGISSYPWLSVAVSGDGSTLLAGGDYGRLYISTDNGNSWNETRPGDDQDHSWPSLACSSEGSTILAVMDWTVMISEDKGNTWSVLKDDELYSCASVSADGEVLLVAEYEDELRYSTDGGDTWSMTTVPTVDWKTKWWSVQVSADGSTMMAVSEYDGWDGLLSRIFLSTDQGSNWFETTPVDYSDPEYLSIALSGDGSVMLAGMEDSRLFISTDKGATWAETQPAGDNDFEWGIVAVSYDGKKLLAGATGSRLYTGKPAAPNVNTFTETFSNRMDSYWIQHHGEWLSADGMVTQGESSFSGTGNKLIYRNPEYELPFTTPQMITARIRINNFGGSDNAASGVGLMTSGSNAGGYNLVFSGQNEVRFLSDFSTWSDPYSFSWSEGTWYWIKFKIADSTLFGKIWEDGISEPVNWPYSQAGWNNFNTGFPALVSGVNGSSSNVSFDDVTISSPDAFIPFIENFNGPDLCDEWSVTSGNTWQVAAGEVNTVDNTSDPNKILIVKKGYSVSSSTPQMIIARIKVKEFMQTSDTRIGVGLLCDTWDGSGYNLVFTQHDNENKQVKFLWDFTAWGNGYDYDFQIDKWYWFKLKYENSTLFGKVWPDGTDEPGSWPYIQTGWTDRSGGVGALTGSNINYSKSAYDEILFADPRTFGGIPVVKTGEITDVTNATATISGTVIDEGLCDVNQRGVCYSIYEEPTTDDSGVKAGSGEGPFTAVLTGLDQGTAYYARAYASNCNRTVYGSEKSFTTECGITEAPFIVDFEGDNFPPACWNNDSVPGSYRWHLNTQASSYGTGNVCVMADFFNQPVSGAAYELTSFDFSISTLDSAALKFDYAYAPKPGDFTDSLAIEFSTDQGLTWNRLEALAGGVGGSLCTAEATGDLFIPDETQWQSIIITLPAGTGKIRFVAINENGNNLYLDNIKVDELLPVISTTPAYSITHSTAMAGGYLMTAGLGDLLERGVCWSVNPDPTTADSVITDEVSGVEEFSLKITGLLYNTRYHFRVWATTTKGTAYGEDMDFTTCPQIATFPVIQDFEDGVIPPECWNIKTDPGQNGWQGSGNSGYGSGNVCILEDFMYEDIGKSNLFSQIFDISSLSPAELSFDYAYRFYVWYYLDDTSDSLYVESSSDMGNSWVRLLTLDGVNDGNGESLCTGPETEWEFTPEADEWLTRHVPLPSGTNQVRFTGVSGNNSRLYLDNIKIGPLTDKPVVETKPAAFFGTLVQVEGAILNSGTAPVLQRGFCLSTTPDPTISELYYAENYNGTAEFSCKFDTLRAGTEYHVRAFATNVNGLSYGADLSFTTCGVTGSPFNEDFDSEIFPPQCWDTNIVQGVYHWEHTPLASGYNQSHASVRAEFYEQGDHEIYELVTGLMDLATFAEPVLIFDCAYAPRPYDAVSDDYFKDTLEIYISDDQGITWDLFSSFSGGEGGNLCTAIPHESSFIPEDYEWLTFTLNLSPATSQIKLVARSHHGNNLYLDNIRVIPSDPVIETMGAENVHSTNAVLGGNIRYPGVSGITGRGVCWSTHTFPTVTDYTACESASSTGEYNFAAYGLLPETEYHVRAYATDSLGTHYGNEITFSTCEVKNAPFTEDFEGEADPPECWTKSLLAGNREMFSPEDYSAYGMGNQCTAARFYDIEYSVAQLATFAFDLSDCPYPVLGFDYAYAQWYDTRDSLVIQYSADYGVTWHTRLGLAGGVGCTLCTTPATGDEFYPDTDDWDSRRLGLPDSANMIRFVAVSAWGNNLFIDNIRIESIQPVITTYQPGNVTNTGAQAGGNVVITDGSKITETGVCFSLHHNPTTDDLRVVPDVFGRGSFSVTITDLIPDNRYYIRAYLITIDSIYYGEEMEFTTCSITDGTFTEDFESDVCPPECWIQDTISGEYSWKPDNSESAYGIGSSSLKAEFYRQTAGSSYELETTMFNLSEVHFPALTLDYAYAPYPGDYKDSLQVFKSQDGGKTWTNLLTLEGGSGGTMGTAPASGTYFRPTDNDWDSLSVILPHDTLMIRLLARSAFGNNLYIDNISAYQDIDFASGTVTDISESGATYSGSVSSENYTLTGRGFCYGLSADPTLNDSTITDESEATGSINGSLSNLGCNTQYFIRPFVTAASDTAYGSQLSFYTLANTPGAPVLGNVTATSIDASVDVNGNPGNTEFAIRITYTPSGKVSVESKYVNAASGLLQSSEDWATAETWDTITVGNLETGKEYTFEVKARNGEGVETALGASASEITCKNPEDAGTISDDQFVCFNSVADTLTSLSVASKYGGTLEYKWQSSVVSDTTDFTDILSSNTTYLVPGTMTATTWFRRLARVDCKDDWSGSVASNVVKIFVEDTAVSGTLAKIPNKLYICKGDVVSATLTAGAGGNGTDTCFYRTKANGTWSNWLAYTPGVTISSTGKTDLEIRTRRLADYCADAPYQTVSWSVDLTAPAAQPKTGITAYLNFDGKYVLQPTDLLSSWSDSGIGVESLSIEPASLTCADLGTEAVIVTVSDSCGNQTTLNLNITVKEGNDLTPWSICNTHTTAAGTTVYSPCTNDGTFYLTSKGKSTTTSDVMHFVHQSITGNATIIVRLSDVKNNGWAGVMIRESCDPGSKMVLVKTQLYSPNIFVGYRKQTNKTVYSMSQVYQLLRWMKIQRNGNKFFVYASNNGISWLLRYSVTLDMNPTILAGFFTENNLASRTTQAWFDHVELTAGLKLGFEADDVERISETESPEIVLYPNPASHQVTISLSDLDQPVQEVSLFSASLISFEGKIMMQFDIRKTETLLNLEGIRPGVYLLRFQNEKELIIKRLTVQ